jgi:hypothetical protein
MACHLPLIVALQMDLKKSINFFIKGILDSSSKEESDASSGLMVATAVLIHGHTKTHVFETLFSVINYT